MAAAGAAAAPLAAPAAVAMPVWSQSEDARRRQADAWMKELKHAHGVGTHGESTEQQRARAAALLAQAVGPGWQVFAPGEEAAAAPRAALSFCHADVNNGNRIYGGWLNVGRLFAAARARAAQAEAEAAVGAAPPPAAAAAAGLAPAGAAEAAAAAAAVMPAEKDGIRALEQVEQLLSDGGALAQYVRQHGAAMAEEAPAEMLGNGTPAVVPPQDADEEEDAPTLALQDDLEVRAAGRPSYARGSGAPLRAPCGTIEPRRCKTPTANTNAAHAQGGERAGVLHRHRGRHRHRQVNDAEQRADADGG
jgi:hypothetical protein